MMRMSPFRLRTASTVKEAAEILAGEDGVTRVVAGGTDLWPNLKRKHQRADTVVSLNGIDALRGIRNGGAELRLGATTTLREVVADEKIRSRLPTVARAVQSISSPLLRNTGTLGGNLCLDTRCTYYNQNEEWRRSIDYCMKEAGEVCWVAPGSPRCWAISAGDSAPILSALDAHVTLVSAEGERSLPLREFFRDDGIDYLHKRPDEILTEVRVPVHPGVRSAFWKLRRRGSIDFAVLTVAAAVTLGGDGTVEDASIYLGAVNSYPTPATATVDFLRGRKLDADTIREASATARKCTQPMHNTDFQPQWRGIMVGKYVEAALREVAGLERERLAPRHGYGLGV